MRSLRSSKCFKTTFELKVIAQKANAYSPCTAFSEIAFLGKFGLKTQNCQFKLKFCA